MSIEYETNISEIALLRENVEFPIFKLQKNLEDICLHASSTEITKAQQLLMKIMKGEIGSIHDVKGL